MSGSLENEYSDRRERLSQVMWIADAPMFMDEHRIERFFDAVVRPKFEHVSTTEENLEEKMHKLESRLGVEGKADLQLPDWLRQLKLVSTLGGEVAGNLSGTRGTHYKHATVAQLKPIWNAERQLEELARHYLLNFPGHVLLRDEPLDPEGWPDDRKWWQPGVNLASKLPRPLVFLDLPERTVLIPTAAEFADGRVVLLYKDLANRLTTEDGGPYREYPSDDLEETERRERRRTYWASFHRFFKSRLAMEVIEDASSQHGSISWIDFRVFMNPDGDTLHLHVTPGGRASAGTFAYNFVRRGYSHGVRIMGTVKSGPDVNALAIYER